MVAGARSLLSSRSLAIPQQLNGSASGCTIEANVLGRCPVSYSSITCRHPHVKPLRKYSSSGGETRWLTPIDRTGDGARASGSNHPSSSNTRCTTLVPTPAVSSLSFLAGVESKDELEGSWRHSYRKMRQWNAIGGR
jgi:hypothetical protein